VSGWQELAVKQLSVADDDLRISLPPSAPVGQLGGGSADAASVAATCYIFFLT
jgi:hypothetical protein